MGLRRATITFVNPWLVGAPGLMAAAGAVTAYGATYPQAQLFGSTVWRTNSPRKLAITFDDGPNPKITPDLLKQLERYEVRATFFVIGRYATGEGAGLLREIAECGHAIGNHTANHVNLFFRTAAQIREELLRCNEVIAGVLGTEPKWFRPPWGARNPWVIPVATEVGMRTAMWTHLPGDWRAKPAAWLIERLKVVGAESRASGESRKGESGEDDFRHSNAGGFGDILCLHDGDHRFLNGDRRATVEALQYWLPRWRDEGLKFVTIEEAVSEPAR